MPAPPAKLVEVNVHLQLLAEPHEEVLLLPLQLEVVSLCRLPLGQMFIIERRSSR
jgi:hypothetical protein